jgi:Na+/H+ antiporter NhaD/arsenite permease-like protein
MTFMVNLAAGLAAALSVAHHATNFMPTLPAMIIGVVVGSTITLLGNRTEKDGDGKNSEVDS